MSKKINKFIQKTKIEIATGFKYFLCGQSGLKCNQSVHQKVEFLPADNMINTNLKKSKIKLIDHIESKDCSFLPMANKFESTRFSEFYPESHGFDSNDFNSVNSSFFSLSEKDKSIRDTNQQVYVCCISFESTSIDELTVEFMEKFIILENYDNDRRNFYLVKNIKNGKSGYVPKCCICKFDQFLNDLKVLRENF
ncbi:unnamed protein product [Brachionus calyciflorus]|uniref:SH3 domain-containing protein n=1 Tax=Brachionus calyciflorus TaxID=104777 RepID=A0A814B1T4_9BILA|nr:unnamed protein product [Brachionus calyciflorus]